MKPEHVLANLNKFLAADRDGVAWEPHGEQLPNAPWLASVFKYLAAEKALASDANLNAFKKLALVPDQFRQLSRPGLQPTPLWPISDRAGKAQLRKVLDALRGAARERAGGPGSLATPSERCWPMPRSSRLRNEWTHDGKIYVNDLFKVLPRGWVVERTFAWLGQYRRLSKDYEQLTGVSEALIHLAMIQL